MNKPEYIVSACLAGFPCRYNGTAFPVEEIIDLVKTGRGIPVCPEELGGLQTPRSQCEIRRIHGEKTVTGIDGFDYTSEYIRGAKISLEIAEKYGIKNAVMKSRSPSCGYGEIYDGTFSGCRIKGNGITSELLAKHGITVYTELNFKQD